MKKTLAFLIAVLMVVAMLPATVLSAAGEVISEALENVSGGTEPAPNPGTTPTPEPEPEPEPAPADTDYFSVYDAEGKLVDHYETLAEADAALQDGYTLKILKNVELEEAYTWGASGIAFTIDGNNVIDMEDPDYEPTAMVTGSWIFSKNVDVTLKNVVLGSEDGIAVTVDGSAVTMSVTFEGCVIFGAVAALKTTGVLAANLGAAVQIAGDANVFVGDTAAIDNAASLSIEGGMFIAGTAVSNAGALYVAGGTFMGQVDAALAQTAGTATIGGGMFVLDAEAGTDIAAVKVSGGVLNVLDATLTAANNVALWAAEGLAANSINIYNMTATGATAWCNANVASARSTLAYVAADAVVENTVTVAIATDLTGANGLILNAAGKTLAAVVLTDANSITAAMKLVPNGGSLKLLANFDLARNGVYYFDYMPRMDVTLDGAIDADTNAVITHAYEGGGAINAFYSNANVTLKNITVKNTLEGGLFLMRNAQFGNLIVGEGAVVEGLGSVGQLFQLQDGISATVAEGGTVKVTHSAVYMGGAGTFTVDGGRVEMTAVSAATLFVIATSNKNAVIDLKVGTLVTTGGPQYLLKTTDAAIVANVKIAAGLKILSLQNPDDTTGFVAVENPIEILNEKGEHVEYFKSFRDAQAALKDGYTLKLLGDHVETKSAYFTASNIDWTLDGSDGNGGRYKLYVPLIADHNNGNSDFPRGFQFGGTNTNVYVNDLIVYGANMGLCAWSATAGVIAKDVFLYANGTTGAANDVLLSDSAAIRLAGGGSITMVGEKSGAYGAGTSYLIRANASSINIYDGVYSGVATVLQIETNSSAYIAGGTFVQRNEAAASKVISAYGSTMPRVVIVDGTFVNRGTAAVLNAGANGSNPAAYWLLGGKYYTNGSALFSWPVKDGTDQKNDFINIMGGEFYSTQTDANATGITLRNNEDKKLNVGVVSGVGASNFVCGIHVDYFGGKYELSAASAYTVAEGDAVSAYYAVDKAFNKVTASLKADITDAVAYKVYANTEDADAPVLNFYGAGSLIDAIMAVGSYNGKIELQSDLNVKDVVAFTSRKMNQGSNILFTSAADAPNGYYTIDFNGTGYRWVIDGGHWVFENVAVNDSTAKHLYGQGANTTIELGDGASFAAYDVPIFLASAKLIVGEGAWIYKMAKPDGSISSNQAIRANGSAVVDIYGKVGFDRNNNLVAGMTGGAINLESAGSAAVLTVHTGAWVGSSTTDDTKALIGDTRTYDGTRYNNQIIIEDGVILRSTVTFFNLDGCILKIGDAKLYDAELAADGSYKKPDLSKLGVEQVAANNGTPYYVFQLYGVEFEAKNLSLDLAAGKPFYIEDTKYTGDELRTINLVNVNVLTNFGNPVMNAYTNNMHLIMNGGSYEIKGGGQLLTIRSDGTSTKGSWTLKGGVRLIKDDATQGMINIYGKQDIVIEDAYIYGGKSTMLSFQSGFNGSLTIKDGTFVRDSMLGSLISAPAGAVVDVVIENGDFLWGSRMISTNTSYDSSFIFMVEPASTLLIKNGNFKLNMDNDAGVKKTDLFYRGIVVAGTAVVENGNFEIIAKQASTASLEKMSLFRVQDSGKLTIKNGNFKGIGNFLALFEQTGSAQIVIEAGNFEATDGFILYSASYTGAAGTYGIVVNGGNYTLQSAANSVNSNDADALIGVDAGSILVNSGLFINNSANSGHVVNKFGTAGSVRLDGGMYFATASQKAFYTSVGNSGSAISVPVTSVAIVAGKTARVDYMGREYYIFVYKVGNLLAPEVDNIKVRLYEDPETTKVVEGEPVDLDDNGLLFTSTISEITYAAFMIELSNMMANMNAEALTVDGYELSYGTLVAPFQNLIETGGVFTKAAFEAAELPHVLIEADKGLGFNEDGDLEIRAAIIDIAPENYATYYTAQPYVTITFTLEGEEVETITWYPTFTTNRGLASVSDVAAKELRDTFAYPAGEYLYRSITQSGAYSRYSKAQQEKLLSLIAHEHAYNHRGECTICDEVITKDLTVEESVLLLGEIGRVNYYRVELEADVSYKAVFSNTSIGSAVFYDEDGNLCELVNGAFACTEAGTYYVVVTTTKLDSSDLTVTHVHETDYTGYCSVCEKDQAFDLEVEVKHEINVIRGDVNYYKVELIAGKYTLVAINGDYTIYDAQGNAVAVENNIFESTGGTYYITVEATFSAKASVYLEHVHNYGHTGVCSYPTCKSVVTQEIPSVYTGVGGKMANGDVMYLKFTVPAGEGGKLYTVRPNMTFIGLYMFYDAEGNRVTDMNLVEGATYYVVVEAQSDCEAIITIQVAHEHSGDDYNYRGEGIFTYNGESVHCSEHNICKTFSLDTVYNAPATEGQTKYWFKVSVPATKHYKFTFSDNVTGANLYGEGTTEADAAFSTSATSATYYDPATGIYYGDAQRWVYVVVTVDATNTAPITIQTEHVHFFSFAGVCADCGLSKLQEKFKNGTYDIAYTADMISYYRVGLANGEIFIVDFEGAEVTWVLMDRDGNQVFSSADGNLYNVPATAPYFLHVTAVADSEAGAKMTLSAHVQHTPDYTGACSVAGCPHDEGMDITEMFTGENIDGSDFEVGDKVYGAITAEAGYTYSVTSNGTVSVKVYNAEGVEVTVTDNAFACAAAGTYYTVLSIDAMPEDAATDLVLVMAKTETPVAAG